MQTSRRSPRSGIRTGKEAIAAIGWLMTSLKYRNTGEIPNTGRYAARRESVDPISSERNVAVVRRVVRRQSLARAMFLLSGGCGDADADQRSLAGTSLYQHGAADEASPLLHAQEA